jgi:hypothetical protein
MHLVNFNLFVFGISLIGATCLGLAICSFWERWVE